MSVKTYKRSDKVRLSQNFKLDEFKCKCGKCDPILLDDKLVTLLQKIRDHFGRSVRVNSGYRCPEHNASPKVGGSPTSHHMKGMAADIRVEGIVPEEVAKYAESIGVQRIGLYDNFVHIGSDTRKSFWLGHEHTKVETFGGKPSQSATLTAPPEGEPGKTVTVELPVLKRGSRGDSVMALQALLEGYGYECGEKGVDGSFGGGTLQALIEYQEDCEMTADGSCGKATWNALLGGVAAAPQ